MRNPACVSNRNQSIRGVPNISTGLEGAILHNAAAAVASTMHGAELEPQLPGLLSDITAAAQNDAKVGCGVQVLGAGARCRWGGHDPLGDQVCLHYVCGHQAQGFQHVHWDRANDSADCKHAGPVGQAGCMS